MQQALWGTYTYKKEEQIIRYLKNGIKVEVHFHDSKADAIVFFNAEKDVLGNPKKLSNNTIDQLLKANGENWKKDKTISMDEEWIDNNNRTAIYFFIEDYLAIMTQGYVDRQMAAEKAAEDEALSDF